MSPWTCAATGVVTRTANPRMARWLGIAGAVVLGWPGSLVMAGEPAANPVFQPGRVWPDDQGVHINAHGGGILFHQGTYFWFGEHKIAGRRGNKAWEGVHAYSSTNLYDWTDEGIALAVSHDPESPIARGCVLERPKVIYNPRTRTFVMWFHLELRGQGYQAALTGLAVADQPAGPYRFVRALRPNAGEWPLGFAYHDPQGDLVRRDHAGGQMSRDMTLFVDDDGTGYHIHAAEENYTLHVSELTDDFLDFTGRYARILPGRHNEAPAICKRNGSYFLLTSGCTGWAPNAARWATAPSMFGPWTEQPNPCVGVNSRNGLGPDLTFGGQSTYILPLQGRPDAFIAMFDEWRPENPIDGRYYWLPIRWTSTGAAIDWMDEWQLSWFDHRGPNVETTKTSAQDEDDDHGR